MIIRSGHSQIAGNSSVKPKQVGSEKNECSAYSLAPKPFSAAKEKQSLAPLDETWVETPHLLLELSGIEDSHQGLAGAVNVGIAGLAALRAGQCLRLSGWEAKLEGASAVALAVSSAASALPGGLADGLSTAAHGTHGLLEAGLGIHETIEAVKNKEDWRHIASGVLGIAHGSASSVSTFIPSLETAGNVLGLVALLGRIGLGVEH